MLRAAPPTVVKVRPLVIEGVYSTGRGPAPPSNPPRSQRPRFTLAVAARPASQKTQFSAITSAIARHSLSMFPEVIPARLMRPEPTM